MLFLTVVLLFSSVCAAAKDEEELKDELIECGEQVGITPDEVETIFKNQLNGANERFKCFIACLIDDSYKFEDDGSFDAESTIENLRAEGSLSENTAKAFKACSYIRGSNECDTTFNVYKCMIENVKEVYNSQNKSIIN